MYKEIVTVVYDRKKEVPKKGRGKVEIRIYLGNGIRKYVTINKCNPFEWMAYQSSQELRTQVSIYKQLVNTMMKNYEELTIENIDNHLGIDKTSIQKKKEKREEKKKLAAKSGFVDFIIEQMAKEEIVQGTQKHKRVTLDAIMRYGKLNSFADLTPKNIKDFDTFLRKERTRSQTTLHNYHKNLKMYTRQAFQLGYIPSNPYENPLCKFKRGTHKERRPLTEDELLLIRNYEDLSPKLEHARDLFIFCAYTGLSYADSQKFNVKTMTEKINENYYIDGKRVKTGHTFFTPILPPAMEVLKKYNYQVPKITNQKANEYLYDIKNILNLNKPLTMHVARHSFATLLLANDVPMENVSRMLGHTNIKTTQIYAHILKSTIDRHTTALTAKIR